MRNNGKGLGLGIFLLSVGIIWLLYIAGIVNWSTLNSLVTLWPLALVAVGIGILFRRNPLIRTATWLVFVAIVIGYGYFGAPTGLPFVIHDSNGVSTALTQVSSDREPGIENGELKLNLGATKLFVDSDTGRLFDASINSSTVKPDQTKKDDGKTACFEFNSKRYNIEHFDKYDKMRSDFHLGKDVPWSLTLNTGAIEGQIDLSDLKVKDLDIATGASKFTIDLGSSDTKLSVKAGASQIRVTLPADTGMKVKMKGALDSTNLDDQGWNKEDGYYYSPNYDSKEYKIDADVEMGLGEFMVTQR